jgi:glucose-1-phosphate cytidylyltransferase
MKTIILAGGLGTRLSEYTHEVPKPMVPVGKIPILIHVMCLYAKHGYSDFVIATGYKSEIIDKYFIENSSKIILNTREKKIFKFSPDVESIKSNWTVTVIFTGDNTMTGGRVKRLQPEIGNNQFMLTYGDGISNIDIKKLIKFHNLNKKMATLSAVRPPVRFGELELNGNEVINFAEKPRLQKGWINGGFFVLESSIFDFIKGDDVMFEREPLEKIVEINELMAFKHEFFWQCMDTKRDKDILEVMWSENKVPWLV